MFTDKIIELGLPLRRERKATQGESTGNVEGQETAPSKELEKADIIFNLVNFPLNQQELEEFLKLRNSLNKVIAIKEKKPKDFDKLLEESHKPKEPVNDEEGQEQPEDEEEKEELIEDDKRNQFDRLLKSYDYKSFNASNGSIMKLSDLRVMHYEHVVEEPKEGQAEGAANLKNSIEELKERVIEEIKATEAKFIGYFNEIMKSKPESRPLTKKTERSEVKEPEPETEEVADAVKKPVEIIPAGYQERVVKLAKDNEEASFGQYLDEEEEPKKHDVGSFEVFCKNTSSIDYSKTTIGHLLLSAVKQCNVLEQKQNEPNKSSNALIKMLSEGFTEVDTVKVFKPAQRQETETSRANISIHKNKLDQSQTQNKDKSLIEIEEKEHEDTDRTNMKITEGSPYHMLFDGLDAISLQNYLIKTLDGQQFGQLERNLLQNLLLPGNARHGMPRSTEKSLPVRKAEVNEIVSFSTIGSVQIQRAIMLREFERMMKEKEQERGFSFFDRSYLIPLSKDALKCELARYMMLSPNIATKYYDKEDGLLVGLYFKNPPGRILRNQWTFSFENATDFRGYLSSQGKLAY